MATRNKAIETMKALREVVADRIADIVNSNEDDLKAEVEGCGFTLNNDFYDLVERLRSLSLAIDMMPPDRDMKMEVTVVDTLDMARNGTINIGTFLEAVDEINFQRAAAVLSVVLDMEIERAADCTRVFFHQCEDLARKFELFQKVARMKTASNNDVMMLMFELFGLQGLEAVDAVTALRNT